MKVTHRIKQLAVAALAFAAIVTTLPAQVLPKVNEREGLKPQIDHTRGGFDTLGRRWGDAAPAPAPAAADTTQHYAPRFNNLVDIHRSSPGQIDQVSQ